MPANVKHQYKSTTHDERFIHFTKLPEGGRFKAVTVFCRKEEGVWFYSFAFCVMADQFCRSMGRKIARRKFFAKYALIAVGGTEFSYDFARTQAEGLIEHVL
jgi:hypothetical protein